MSPEEMGSRSVMRSYIVSQFATVDGFTAGPGDDLSVLPFDGTFNDHNLERLQSASTMVMGANGYRGFLSYWPGVDEDPEADPVEREIARLNNSMDKLVVSDSITAEELGGWADTVRIVRRDESVEAIREVKEGDGDDLITFGSTTTVDPLLRAGVVDELHVMVGAGLVGSGTPICGADTRVGLELLDVVRREGSGNVVLRYAVTT